MQQFKYVSERKDEVYILQGKANIENEVKQGLNLSFDIKNTDESVILELPYLFYPGYNAQMSEGDIKTNVEIKESENGFLQINLPDDIKEAKITITYKGTILEEVSYIVSGVSTIIFISYVIYFIKKRRER